jgi:voltage-gated sodium channel
MVPRNWTEVKAAWPGFRDALPAFFASRRYEVGITALIVFNALLLGLETFPSMEQRFGLLIDILNALILLVFIVEIGLKIVAFGWPFWRDGWNWFDLAVVAVAILPMSDGLEGLRALRAVRLLRLVAVVPSLRRVVEGLLRALPSLGSIVVLLLLLLYVFSVMATRMFGTTHPDFFGSLGASAFSLFTVMTLEGWPDLARKVMESHPAAWMFFISFIMLSSWAVLNLFIGVIVDSMQSNTVEEVEEVERLVERDHELVMGELATLRKEVGELKAVLEQVRDSGGRPPPPV